MTMPTPFVENIRTNEVLFEKRILVVDDAKSTAQIVEAYLLDSGFCNVWVEIDSRAVMNVIDAVSPDLVLLDIFMPHVTGLELLEQIRANPIYDSLLVLMLSSAGRDEQYKSLDMGAMGFIQKPVTADELTKTIARTFRVAGRLGLQ